MVGEECGLGWVVGMPVSIGPKSGMLKDRNWWRHTLYYRSHLAPNQERVGEEYEVGTGSDRNRKWSKPEVIETGSGRNRKWSKPEVVETGSGRNRKWSKPEVIETGSDRNRKWSKPEVVETGSDRNGEECGLAVKGGPWVGAVGRRRVRGV